MMAISQFSLIGLIVLMVIIVTGTVLKLVLRRKRRELEGFHGAMDREDQESEEDVTKDWESL